MQGVPYSEAISSMLWPDAAYAVVILSQYIQNPGPEQPLAIPYGVSTGDCPEHQDQITIR